MKWNECKSCDKQYFCKSQPTNTETTPCIYHSDGQFTWNILWSKNKQDRIPMLLYVSWRTILYLTLTVGFFIMGGLLTFWSSTIGFYMFGCSLLLIIFTNIIYREGA
jgi:hypothetical protein